MLPGGTWSIAAGINNQGQVEGYTTVNGGAVATVWNGTTPTALGMLPGATSSFGQGINNSGTVVGLSVINNLAIATVWDDTTPTALAMLPGGVASFAYDINNSGEVVGDTRFLDGTIEATLWDDGVAIALGMLAGDSNSVALAINDAGQIAGWSFGPGQVHATLWVDPPALQTPLPATLPLFATGLGALGLLGWRRKKTAAG
jgi:uncharacterized membrane protein